MIPIQKNIVYKSFESLDNINSKIPAANIRIPDIVLSGVDSVFDNSAAHKTDSIRSPINNMLINSHKRLPDSKQPESESTMQILSSP